MLGKNASIRIKLPTAACWSQEKKREEGVKPTCFMLKSDFGTTDKSSLVEALNLIIESKSLPEHWVTCDVEEKENLAIILFCGFWFPCLMRRNVILFSKLNQAFRKLGLSAKNSARKKIKKALLRCALTNWTSGRGYTNPSYTVYFKSYYQYFLQALTPSPTFTLKLLVFIPKFI